jgi:hypothetical protein
MYCPKCGTPLPEHGDCPSCGQLRPKLDATPQEDSSRDTTVRRTVAIAGPVIALVAILGFCIVAGVLIQVLNFIGQGARLLPDGK